VIALDRIFSAAGFVLLCLPVLAGPWLFGAWEMWWFWPFALCVFGSACCLGLRLLIRPITCRIQPQPGAADPGAAPGLRLGLTALLSLLPFLAYAFVRYRQADVALDAERSFLLFLTPCLVAVQVLLGCGPAQRRILQALLLADLGLLGLYGIVNHAVTGSRCVLWMPGYQQYVVENRASGSYFCPDHFSGVMEIACCLSLGLILDRAARRRDRALGIGLLAIGVAGVILSKSRGGGLTLAVILLAGLTWGFSQWPASARWSWRATVLGVIGLLLLAFGGFEPGCVSRFKNEFGWTQAREKTTWREKKETVLRAAEGHVRVQMIAAALRAWQTRPVFGIGPGMHQHLWPHFAPSDPGDPERGIWPKFPNHAFHSYAVHGDWIQLLEEYGMAGLALFAVPAGAGLAVLLAVLRSKFRPATLGAVLAFAAMAFHSLGDFNLQMPATAWLFAAVLAQGCAGAGPASPAERRLGP
jgi:O-antigen ligase